MTKHTYCPSCVARDDQPHYKGCHERQELARLRKALEQIRSAYTARECRQIAYDALNIPPVQGDRP